ncbi:restriction endonuclease subunit S [Vibrio vulnificus]|nr:restriction endonuclease subunit S [Vibrio vulnificus]EID4390667.1 restriction endonuclease subunit S [Vibrio vulnificus]
MGKYSSYPKYKTLDVEWLDCIPEHWSNVSLKMMIDVRDGTHDTPAYVEPSDESYPLVTSKDVTGGYIDLSDCKRISRMDYELIVKRSGVAKGDILMPMIGTVGSPILLEQEVEIAIKNLALFRTSVGDNKLCRKYLFYFLNSSECSVQFSLESRGGVQNFVSLGTLRNLGLPLVPRNEQTQIANFLDHETAKIDTLIEKQQQLIKLLKEKRQAVISHAVTKGLNSQAPMKDSGVEWLGEVPEHWVVSRFKYCTDRVIVGIAEAATHAYSETGTVLIRSTNIKEDGLTTHNLLYLKTKFADQNESKYIRGGDIVTVRTGYPGISAVVPDSLDRSHCFTNLISTPKIKFVGGYLTEYLNSDMGKAYFDLNAWGSAQKNISVPILQEFPIAHPDENEQQEILRFVEQQRSKFDNLLNASQKSIEFMQERRTALISAAVTGKIDVRNWLAPTHQDQALEQTA